MKDITEQSSLLQTIKHYPHIAFYILAYVILGYYIFMYYMEKFLYFLKG